jgi:hypothetical protein
MIVESAVGILTGFLAFAFFLIILLALEAKDQRRVRKYLESRIDSCANDNIFKLHRDELRKLENKFEALTDHLGVTVTEKKAAMVVKGLSGKS